MIPFLVGRPLLLIGILEKQERELRGRIGSAAVTIIDVHPDDLLEREMAGALSAPDEGWLAAHVARCASCRLERQLRADFDRELGNRTAPVILQALVASALHAARASDACGEPGTATRHDVPVRRSRRRVELLLTAGVALATGLAAARPDLVGQALDFVSERVGAGLGVSSAGRVDAPAPPARASAAPTDRTEWASSVPSSNVVPSSTLVRRADVTRPELPAPSAASPPGSRKSRSARFESGSPRIARQRVEPGTVEQERAPARDPGSARLEPFGAELKPKPVRGSESDTSAAILFERANAARRRREGAAALYRELQAHFPESAEARLSFAILGRMQLDTGDAESAIASFEAYLSAGDRSLREQAMAGRALTRARLGDGERERQSWLALLGAYPRSSYAGLARQRLAEDRR